MTAAPNSPPRFKAVIYSDRCVGFIMPRGRDGFEGFTIEEISVGLFVTEADAVAAIFRKPGGAS